MTTEVYVEYEEYETSSYHSPEQFGDWESNHFFDVKGITLSLEKYMDLDTITVDFDIESGDIAYVLSMTYSGGDSFGRSSGEGEIIWVFETYQHALNAKDIWMDNQGAYYVKFDDGQGNEVKLTNPAFCYFSHIEGMRIQEFLVE